jgi:hypothetical protein
VGSGLRATNRDFCGRDEGAETVSSKRFPGSVRIAPNWRRFVHAFCLCNLPIELQGPFRGLCPCPGKLRFPTAETGVGRDSVLLSQCDGKPSISRCLDHSAGKSVRRATPMPCGSTGIRGHCFRRSKRLGLGNPRGGLLIPLWALGLPRSEKVSHRFRARR